LLDLESTYKQFGERVFNIALQYLRNVEDAEEVTQDVFLTVYNKQSQFEGKAQLGTWIHRIAVNKSLDFIKARNFSYAVITERVVVLRH
jgi:RNA polymerase sigma-70 factor (ECF subfamily)